MRGNKPLLRNTCGHVNEGLEGQWTICLSTSFNMEGGHVESIDSNWLKEEFDILETCFHPEG